MKFLKFFYNSLDNLLFVFGGVLIHVFAARNMETAEFSLFTLIFTIFLLGQALALSFIHEPFVRFYNVESNVEAKRLLLSLTCMMMLWSLPFFVICAVLIIFGVFEISWPDYVLICSSLIVSLVFQFVRRIHHFTQSRGIGAISSFIYLTSTCLLLLVVSFSGLKLNFVNTIAVIGLSATMSMVYNLSAAKLLAIEVRSECLDASRKVLDMRTGLVVFSGNMGFLAVSTAYVLLFPIWGNFDDVANMRMAFILLLPLNHLIASLNTLVLPLIKLKLTAASSEMSSEILVLKWFGISMIIAFGYGLLMMNFFSEIMFCVFDKRIHWDHQTVFMLSTLPALGVAILPFNMYLRLIGKQNYVFQSALITLVCLVGVASLPITGVVVDYFNWVVFCYLTAYLVGAILSGFRFFVALRKRKLLNDKLRF